MHFADQILAQVAHGFEFRNLNDLSMFLLFAMVRLVASAEGEVVVVRLNQLLLAESIFAKSEMIQHKRLVFDSVFKQVILLV